jgi:hypothetical protein
VTDLHFKASEEAARCWDIDSMLAIGVQTFFAPSRIFVPDDRHARAQLHQPLGIGR